MPRLAKVSISNSEHIEEIPQYIGQIESLEELSLIKLPNCTKLPSFKLASNLSEMHLSGLPKLAELPEDLGNVNKLRLLKMSGLASLKGLPSSIVNYDILEIVLINCPTIAKPTGFTETKGSTSTTYKKSNVVQNQNGQTVQYSLDKNEVDYYNYKHNSKFEKYVSLEDVSKTKNKALVKYVSVNTIKFPELAKEFLATLDKYPNLSEVSVSFDESYRFSEITNVSNNVKDVFVTNYSKSSGNSTDIQKLLSVFGNVETLRLVNILPSQIDSEFNFAELKSLEINPYHPSSTASLSFVHGLISKANKLEKLILQDCVTTVPGELFFKKYLKHVDIKIFSPSTNSFSIPDAVGDLAQLEYFKVFIDDSKIAIRDIKISPRLNDCKKLKTLYLLIGGDPARSVSFVYPDGISNLSNLEELFLQNVKFMPVGLDRLTIKEKSVKVGK